MAIGDNCQEHCSKKKRRGEDDATIGGRGGRMREKNRISNSGKCQHSTNGTALTSAKMISTKKNVHLQSFQF